MRISRINIEYTGASNRKSVYDLTIPENWNEQIVVFLHGYMGYKDWGAWHLMEDYFVEKGFGFVKFNSSHNGGTVLDPIDFPDLEAFSKNTYSKEMIDIATIHKLISSEFPTATLHLIGHSRGGGLAALQSDLDLFEKIICLAPISNIATRFPEGEALKTWKETGVRYRENGRTKQNMPHLIEQFEDYLDNAENLSIERACLNRKSEIIVIHGADDKSVLPSEGKQIAEWAKCAYHEIEGEAHTFGAKQPWNEITLPLGLLEVCKIIDSFLAHGR